MMGLRVIFGEVLPMRLFNAGQKRLTCPKEIPSRGVAFSVGPHRPELYLKTKD